MVVKRENRIGLNLVGAGCGTQSGTSGPRGYTSSEMFSNLLKRLEDPVATKQGLTQATGTNAIVSSTGNAPLMKDRGDMIGTVLKPNRIKPVNERSDTTVLAAASLPATGNPRVSKPESTRRSQIESMCANAIKSTRMFQWIRENQNSNTRRTYDSGFRGFQSYLQQEGIERSEILPVDIADYLRQRLEQDGVAASTIAGDRAAIADALKYEPNVEMRTMHLAPIVCDTMKLCMTKAAQSQPKQHVSAQLMKEIVDYYMLSDKLCTNLCLITPSSQVSTQMWMNERNVCLMLVMMTAMLRESEAVALKLEDVFFQEEANGVGAVSELSMSAAAAVPFNHVAWVGPKLSQVALMIRQSKTDQRKIGADVLLAVNWAVPNLCPVRRLQHYLVTCQKANIRSEYLFCKADGTQLANSTPCGIVQRVVEELNQWAQTKGEGSEKWGPAQLYGSHSLRRGGVTEARLSGVDMFDIKQHGRWKSMAVYGYVGPTVNEKLGVTRNLFGGLNGTAPGPESYTATGHLQSSVSQLPSAAAAAAVTSSAALIMSPGRNLTGKYGPVSSELSHRGPGGNPNGFGLPVRNGQAEKLAWVQMKAKIGPISHSLNYVPREVIEAARLKRSPVKKNSTVAKLKSSPVEAQMITSGITGSATNIAAPPAPVTVAAAANQSTPKRDKKGRRSAADSESDDEDYRMPLREGELDEEAIAALQMEEWQQGYGSGASDQAKAETDSDESDSDDESSAKDKKQLIKRSKSRQKTHVKASGGSRESATGRSDSLQTLDSKPRQSESSGRKSVVKGSARKKRKKEATVPMGAAEAGEDVNPQVDQLMDSAIVTVANTLPRASKRKAMENIRATYA